MTPEDKIVEAIDRNTEAVKLAADRAWWQRVGIAVILVLILSNLSCPRAKASPLISDGDEIASVGTTQVITPHPSWAAPLEGTQWISIAQTGWPLLTWLPNGTVVSFSEAFSLDSMPSFAMVTWAADDSASLRINDSLVVPEAPMAGNTYSVCSDFAPTCRYHTSVDVLPWLLVGSNEIRFDVAQRGGWSFGLNYAVGLGWLDEPVSVPEPGTWILGLVLAVMVWLGVWDSRREARRIRELDFRTERLTKSLVKYHDALEEIADGSLCLESRRIARKALEE